MFKYFFVLLFLTLNSFALEALKIENGRYVAVEKNIVDKKQKTLIFLPGIFRGLDKRDEFIQLAQKAKLNFVSMHFSLHPESLLLIPSGETAHYKYHSYKAGDLAEEVMAVIQQLKISQPIVVGLSYSSVVTTELAKANAVPLIIETAPMIRYDESDPAGSQVTSFWKNYLGMNPIYGAYWKSLYLDQVYQQYWSSQVDGILQKYPQYQNKLSKDTLVKAYAKLSIIADGFDYTEQDFSKATPRLFILGQKELPQRFVLQQKAITLYEQQTGRTQNTVVLKDAGHIIPSEAPKAYLKLLQQTVAE